ncbi:hypothetical protein BT67DRAFT_49170 [Trichocladium antarcticum]|uniref:Uncharacterized protein n=1 Tax=Trichocladium antarcticum TaxID=1450529 RepID=A0AAN6UII2_9PEZI|nr:hypothetical protein BT67DRAFT_49170 [Trichocladium antarcticum]
MPCLNLEQTNSSACLSLAKRPLVVRPVRGTEPSRISGWYRSRPRWPLTSQIMTISPFISNGNKGFTSRRHKNAVLCLAQELTVGPPDTGILSTPGIQMGPARSGPESPGRPLVRGQKLGCLYHRGTPALQGYLPCRERVVVPAADPENGMKHASLGLPFLYHPYCSPAGGRPASALLPTPADWRARPGSESRALSR